MSVISIFVLAFSYTDRAWLENCKDSEKNEMLFKHDNLTQTGVHQHRIQKNNDRRMSVLGMSKFWIHRSNLST